MNSTGMRSKTLVLILCMAAVAALAPPALHLIRRGRAAEVVGPQDTAPLIPAPSVAWMAWVVLAIVLATAAGVVAWRARHRFRR